ncbi:MAG TPA: TIGR02587 family membrane protein [Thermoanaerobaculia bacterium]|nr:TIGR02587 family membrane protein [Thermoanaerobaculia bacterium]
MTEKRVPSRRAALEERTLDRVLREYARGVIGGLLFSLPLLYTMEVWWAGFIARPPRLLIYLLAGFLLLFAYNRYAGLHEDAGWAEVAFEAVEELGLGLLVSAGILWLIGQIDSGMPWSEVLGKVVVEGMPAAIGVSVGAAQLGGDGKGGQGMKGREDKEKTGLPGQIALALCGAVLFASNVAPTEEIIQIAAESTAWRLLGLALLSLLLGGIILFYSDFTGSRPFRSGDGIGRVLSLSVISYAVALCASAFILWFFGRFDGGSLATGIAQTVTLGVASSLGASAGRLLLLS